MNVGARESRLRDPSCAGRFFCNSAAHGRQSHRKDRADPGLAHYIDAASVAVDNGFADCQAKTTAAFGSAARFVGPVKPLKDMWNIFGRDARSGIGDCDDGTAVFDAGYGANLALQLVVVKGVGQEIRDELAKKVGVAQCLDGRKVGVDCDAALFGERANAFHAGMREFGQIDTAFLSLFLASVEARELEQRFGELPHVLGGVQTDCDRFTVFRSAALTCEGRLRFRDDDGERRAEFVGGVGGELLLLRERGFEPGKG